MHACQHAGMAQMSWRSSDELAERVRRAARASGRSMNDYVTAVLDAATDPDLAGDEATAPRERLARAGFLVPAGRRRTRPAGRRGPRPRRGVGRHAAGLPRRTGQVTVFADASALVTLYVEEEGHELVRDLPVLAVGEIARVEVPAAFWRKTRLGELDAVDARVLVDDFEADYRGTSEEAPRFVVVQVAAEILDSPAAAIDPKVTTMAVFDHTLRAAAAAEGRAVSPAGPPAGR